LVQAQDDGLHEPQKLPLVISAEEAKRPLAMPTSTN